MEAVRVIGEFKCRAENDQTKKRFNQENYIRQRVAKGQDQVVKQQKKNRRMEMDSLMCQCLAGRRVLQDLNIKELSDLTWSIDNQLKAISHKMEYFHDPTPQPGAAAAALAAVPVAQKTTSRGGTGVTGKSDPNGHSSTAPRRCGHGGPPRRPRHDASGSP